MQFNSLYFILFFFPITLAAYYLGGRKSERVSDWILIAASFFFYGLTNVWYPVMLAALILVNWGISRRIFPDVRETGEGSARADRRATVSKQNKKQTNTKAASGNKHWMVFGVILNVAVLAVFKYTNFFIENLNEVFRRDWPMVNLILPLGISFIIFTQISWIVDSFRGETLDVSFREYVLFSAFFPKLSEGPIYTMKDFLPQMRKEERLCWNYEEVMIGLRMFICGLFKKVIFADPLGTAVNTYYSLFEYRSSLDSLILMFAYTFQIYFDFSGYSDMAIGVSKMLGFDLPANFNSPYKACTVTDFWRRWHISLTSFLREYIYFPLGGSRKGKTRTYLNIMIVYLVSGFWHGANWTFVLWGIFHGLAQVIERLLGKAYRAVWKPVRWMITFGFVSYMWVLFRCSSWTEFQRFRWHLRDGHTWYLSSDMADCFRIPGMRAALSVLHLPVGDSAVGAASVILVLAVCLVICLCLPNNQERKYKNNVVTLLVSAGMAAVCVLSLSSVSTFIYNDF